MASGKIAPVAECRRQRHADERRTQRQQTMSRSPIEGLLQLQGDIGFERRPIFTTLQEKVTVGGENKGETFRYLALRRFSTHGNQLISDLGPEESHS